MARKTESGVADGLDVLVADKGLATARRDLAQAKYNYLLAFLRLKQQAGTLTLEDLEKTAKNFQTDATNQVARR